MKNRHSTSETILKFKLFTLLGFILCLSNISSAQIKQLKFNKIEGSNGINLGKINAITQDSNGFMWFSELSRAMAVSFLSIAR